MDRIVKPLLELDVSSVAQILDKGIGEENLNLFYKLSLVALRKKIVRIFIENGPDFDTVSSNSYKSIKEIVNLIIKVFPEKNDDVSRFLRSVFIYLFPNPLEKYTKKAIDDMYLIEDVFFRSIVFCGFEEPLKNLIIDKIYDYCSEIVESFSENFEESALEKTTDELDKKLLMFKGRFPSISIEKENLRFRVYNRIVQCRAGQLFEIVTSYPDSKPSLEDLRDACNRTNTHKDVAERAKEIFSGRLLHLGAGTYDIVTQYINAIQAFNIIDPSGGLTRSVSPPIQQYLTTRSDLLSTIVNLILEDSSLMDSGFSAHKPNDDDILRDPSVQAEIDDNWKPEPLHSHIRDLNSLVREGSDSDALALLLNVYGSISSFVSQLEKEISRRVELTPGYLFDAEVKAVELLKKRFGNQIFLNCEVILQDVSDSKRLANRIDDSFLQPLVVSHMYWPEFAGEQFKLPAIVQEQIIEFEENFKTIKTQRRLEWINSAGIVEIELSFEDGESMIFCVPPITASTILLLNNQNEISIEDVVESLGISNQGAESALSYWTKSNVLIKNNDLFKMSPTKPVTSEVYNDETKNAEEECEEEDDECSKRIKMADKFAPFAKTVLASRPKEVFTIQSFYSLLVRFVRGNDFKITEEEFIKLIPVWIDKGMVSVDGETVTLVKPI